MRPRRTRAAGNVIRARRSGGVSGPSLETGRPRERYAAAGAKMSRPWNVLDSGSRITSGDRITCASFTPPSRFHASESSPLSGPTMEAPDPVSSATASRSEPTPGSTTARYTAPSGRYGTARLSASAPEATAWRGIV